MNFVGLSIVLFLLPALAGASVCSKRELELKNCKIQRAKLTISIWREKISSYDGVHRQLIDFPVVQDKSIWEVARLRPFGNRLFLELVLMTEADASGIQTKKWFVYEIEKSKLVHKLEKSLYKRLVVATANGEVTQADRSPKYGLRAIGKTVEWYVGRNKGSI